MPGDLAAQMEDFAATLRVEVAKVDDQRAELRAEYLAADAELKASVAKAKRLISAYDSQQGKKKPKPKPTNEKGVDADKIDALLTHLKENYDGQEFAGPVVWEEFDIPKDVGIGSEPQFSKALRMLHERGALRLVRQGGIEGLGNRTKVWRLT